MVYVSTKEECFTTMSATLEFSIANFCTYVRRTIHLEGISADINRSSPIWGSELLLLLIVRVSHQSLRT